MVRHLLYDLTDAMFWWQREVILLCRPAREWNRWVWSRNWSTCRLKMKMIWPTNCMLMSRCRPSVTVRLQLWIHQCTLASLTCPWIPPACQQMHHSPTFTVSLSAIKIKLSLMMIMKTMMKMMIVIITTSQIPFVSLPKIAGNCTILTSYYTLLFLQSYKAN